MHFAQLYTPGIAQCSYVIGTGNKCVVVDPVRNIDAYLDKAKEFGMEIVGVLETHLHADFISGHMELADITGAKIYAPEIANCTFPHHALANGEEFEIDQLRFKLIETPGHTPDCTVYLVTDLERGEEPVLLFTGDTLMVGDVGRPDLFPNREEELAEKLFNSLNRLKELPDHIEIYPAHGMGSLCGRALSAKLWSTIGVERRFNYALQHTELESFKKDLLTDMPAAPDHFARCSEINRKGPELIKNLVKTIPYEAAEADKAVQEGFTVVDVRP
ncbi:MAG: MBL fold metallo-hydrolase, partial [Bacillota bacterium]